ncbi:MAG: YbaB/EbfC family nucleoid-associated protein [Spirochaetota bacterium]|jgi:DNA-binding YbaB/EbfC family protein|nr:YbaB/EbfC family nucleoid-associated protein [Spirochaetota bacterium]
MFENFGDLVKMAKDVQARMKDIQQELPAIRVKGDAGAGMVYVEMNGRHEVTRVTILDEALADREILEGLVHAAVNDAVNRINEELKTRMGAFGVNIPGLTDML